jgi:hypothetical protein
MIVGAVQTVYGSVHPTNSGSSPNCVVLVSGSLTFIDSYVGSACASKDVSIIGLLDHTFHGRLRNGCPSGISPQRFNCWNIWNRIRHETVGGATRFVGLFCSSMEVNPSITTLRRSLNQVVDFGIRQNVLRILIGECPGL